MDILITNDDGIESEGLKALKEALATIGTVAVVAPDREQSTSSHAITLHRPLRVKWVSNELCAVDGTPADCVNLSINGILKSRPKVLVSGINKGENLGDDVTYSGTVSAAIEGTLIGIPSIAISLVAREDFMFEAAASFSKKIVKLVLAHGLPKDTLLNINVPNLPEEEIEGVEITRQGKRVYGDAIVEKTDPRGKKYYWIGGDILGYREIPGSDFDAISRNRISVTPLKLDLTDYNAMETLETW
ncbi:MAG: 5'/3'-nucleotidase SurE, partial [Deltaproteobacteria bacterium]